MPQANAAKTAAWGIEKRRHPRAMGKGKTVQTGGGRGRKGNSISLRKEIGGLIIIATKPAR